MKTSKKQINKTKKTNFLKNNLRVIVVLVIISIALLAKALTPVVHSKFQSYKTLETKKYSIKYPDNWKKSSLSEKLNKNSDEYVELIPVGQKENSTEFNQQVSFSISYALGNINKSGTHQAVEVFKNFFKTHIQKSIQVSGISATLDEYSTDTKAGTLRMQDVRFSKGNVSYEIVDFTQNDMYTREIASMIGSFQTK